MDQFIKRGWDNYRTMVVPADAGDVQVKETQQAFYAGAAVLFETIMNILDPGAEPTDTDLQKMSELQAELHAWGQQFDKKILNLPEH